MRKRQNLISKGICVFVGLLLVAVGILLRVQMRIVFPEQGKSKREILLGQGEAERSVSFGQESIGTKFPNFQLKKAEKTATQEIRGVRDVHKQSEVLNNEVQPKNRLPVFLLFLLLTDLMWECSPKCQWFRYTEFKEKTCAYSRVPKRRGPPISALFC